MASVFAWDGDVSIQFRNHVDVSVLSSDVDVLFAVLARKLPGGCGNMGLVKKGIAPPWNEHELRANAVDGRRMTKGKQRSDTLPSAWECQGGLLAGSRIAEASRVACPGVVEPD